MMPSSSNFPPIERTMVYMLCAEYTKRYQDILVRLQAGVFLRGTTVKQATQKFEAMEGPLRAYIDLCAEELFVHENGVIPDEIWLNWAEGIRIMFEIPAVAELWGRVGEEERYSQLKGFLESNEGTK